MRSNTAIVIGTREWEPPRWLAAVLTPLAWFQGYSGCLRCHISWRFVESHATRVSSNRGMFPLCEHCWSELTPEQRLPYYRKLYFSWEEDKELTWEQLEQLVLAGG